MIYYNGGNKFEHGIYTQNENGTKRIVDNIIFNNASHGIHAYGSSSAYLNNFYIEGNTLFENGNIGYQSGGGYGLVSRNILLGGSVVARNPVITNNFTYSLDPNDTSLNLGYNAGSSNGKVTGNYFMIGRVVLGGSSSGLDMSGNTIYASSTEGFNPSSYGNNSWLASRPGGTKAFVRPNIYEPNRANLTIYNWGLQNEVAISASDLAGVNLKPGMHYELHNAQDFYGDVVSGIYDGSSIRVPMTGRSVAQPLGLNFKPDSTFPEFGVFVLIAQ